MILLLACAPPGADSAPPDLGSPLLVVRPEAFSFGERWVGDAPSGTLLLENAGDAAFVVEGVGAESPLVVKPPELPLDLAPGGQALVAFTLPIAEEGLVEARLTVASDAGEVEVPVNATGIMPVATWDGPAEAVGACSGTWEGALTNTGSAPLAVYGVTADHGQVDAAPGILAPGDSLPVTVSLDAGTERVTVAADTDAGTVSVSFDATIDPRAHVETFAWRGDRVDLLLATEVPGVGSFSDDYEEFEARVPQLAARLFDAPFALRVGLVLDATAATVLDVSGYADADALADAMRDALATGTSAWEEPIVRAGLALEDTPGFPREEANLAVVLVHDEDNGPSIPPEAVLAAWEVFVPDGGLLTVHGMAPLTDCGPGVATWIPALADATGGASVNLCTRDFDGFFAELLDREDTLLRTFALKTAPTGTVSVTVGGAPATATVDGMDVTIDGAYGFGDAVEVRWSECAGG